MWRTVVGRAGRGTALGAIWAALLLLLAGAGPASAAAPTGGLFAFGYNLYGQLGSTANSGTRNPNPTPTLVALPGQSGSVTQIAAGQDHSVVATSGGQLYAFGDNKYGQLGSATNTATTNPNPTPTLVALPGQSGTVTQIAAGQDHSLVATSSGQLYAFGDNKYGQLGNPINTGATSSNPTPTLVILPGQSGTVTQIAAGQDHSLVATSGGQLYAFGDNRYGQLGSATNTGTPNPNSTPTLVALPGQNGPVTQIAAGRLHSLAVTSSGQVYGFGQNTYGELGNATNNGNSAPNPAPMLIALPGQSGTVTQIAGGAYHSLVATSGGQVYAFGYNRYGDLASPTNNGTSKPNPTPTLVTLPGQNGRVTQLAGGSSDSLVVTSSGQLYAFGYNSHGELGTTTNNSSFNANPTPTLVPLPPGTTIDSVAKGPTADHTLAIAAARPDAQTGAASGVSTDAATLNARVNPNGEATSSHFEYGASTAYGSSTNPTSTGSDGMEHSVSEAIGGLSANTSYHFRVVATSRGGTETGVDQVFTTAANAPGAPTTTTPPNAVAPSNAPLPVIAVTRKIVIRHRFLVHLLTSGQERVRLVCPVTAKRGCSGHLQLRSQFGKSRAFRYALAAGQSHTLRLRLRLSRARLRYITVHHVKRLTALIVIVETGPGSATGAQPIVHIARTHEH